MTSLTNIRERIFSIKDESTFNEVALELFSYQARFNPVYKQYLQLLRTDLTQVTHYLKIPFLPISFFKTHRIICSEDANAAVTKIFTSSGTSGADTSKHYVVDTDIYKQSFVTGFERIYGAVKDWNFLALLPSYLERDDSSLIYMVHELMKISNRASNQFYLYDHEALNAKLLELESRGEKSILIGISYALLDFLESYQPRLLHTIVMETGGMKGKREELTKVALHQVLKNGFHCTAIHSEYGMTELLSQAYSTGNGLYTCPNWMKVIAKEINDPFQLAAHSQTAQLNIIDLANINSCCFIESGDIGKVHEDGSFEVLGRMENSILRGCNLMIE